MGRSGAAGSPIRLALSETPTAAGVPARWIGPLVALGGMARRYSASLTGRQLVVAISVPQRDFAAALIGCGWVVQKPRPVQRPPLDVFRELNPGSGVRVVTDSYVITDTFLELVDRRDAFVRLKSRNWAVSHVEAVVECPNPPPRKVARLPPGSLARWAGLTDSWSLRLAAAHPDLALVGTVRWLHADLAAFVTTDGDVEPTEADSLGALLLPETDRSASAFTTLHAASRLADGPPSGDALGGVVLDGGGAIKHLALIEAPVVICVVDRSVADESAAELVTQLRNTRGEPVSLSGELRWRPPAGVEALAFTVAA